MKYIQGKFPIIKKTTLAKEVYDLTIFCPKVVKKAEIGQFVTIFIEGFTLRRPISICDMNKDEGTLRLVFEVRGKGTKALTRLNEGDMIDMLAPLGNGFKLREYKNVITVGGGIGTPPMLPLSKHFGEGCTSISGFRNAAAVILQEDIRASGAKAVLCTDDGSAGKKGFVTDALREEIAIKTPEAIFACGPGVMLRGVVELAKENNIPCQVSMEERMGCGIGACLVCACRVVRNGEEYYAHVCQEGPVFDSKEVLW